MRFRPVLGASCWHGDRPFVWNPVEDAKWALRQVYYREQTYYDDHDRYTNVLDNLELPPISLEGYTWPPQISASSTAFNALVVATRQNHIVQIRQNGRVWMEESESPPTNVEESTWGQVKAPQASEH